MAFHQCFFYTPEIIKIVIPKVLQNCRPKTPNCTCWPEEQIFPRSTQYRTRLNGTLISFFGIARVFSQKIPPKGSSHFFEVLRQKGSWKITKIFPALWDFLQKKFGCCRREYFDTLKCFCYFWALDMAPTSAGPGLFSFCFSERNCFSYSYRENQWMKTLVVAK